MFYFVCSKLKQIQSSLLNIFKSESPIKSGDVVKVDVSVKSGVKTKKKTLAKDEKSVKIKRNNKISTGPNNFKSIIKNSLYYVDKSLLINAALTTSGVNVISRPRGFGKSLSLSMLSYFLDVKNARANKKLFNGLKILEKRNICKHYQGKYPVIKIDFSGFVCNIDESNPKLLLEHAKKIFRILVADIFLQQNHLLKSKKLEQAEREDYLFVTQYRVNPVVVDIESCIKRLCIYLKKEHGVEPYILIDDFDTPFSDALLKGYFNELVNFMNTFLQSTFKSGVHRGAIIAGISNYDFTDCSFNWFTAKSKEFEDCFGYTEEEVTELLKRYKLSDMQGKVNKMYGGYRFGNSMVYNPWSVGNFLRSNELTSYWIDTVESTVLVEVLSQKMTENKEIVERLLRKEEIEVSVDLKMQWFKVDSQNDLLNYFVQLGYLSFSNKSITHLRVPNEEVMNAFHKLWKRWAMKNVKNYNVLSANLMKAYNNCDIKQICYVFETIISNLQPTNGFYERSYQSAIYGCFNQTQCTATLEKIGGLGYIDLFVSPKGSNKCYLLIEFKQINLKNVSQNKLVLGHYSTYMELLEDHYKKNQKSIDKQLEASAREALKQINSNEYENVISVSDCIIYKIGISAFGTHIKYIYEKVERTV